MTSKHMYEGCDLLACLRSKKLPVTAERNISVSFTT
jgi:hypothetical protein